MRDLAWQCPKREWTELDLGWYEARAEGPKGNIILGFPFEDTLLLHLDQAPQAFSRHSPKHLSLDAQAYTPVFRGHM